MPAASRIYLVEDFHSGLSYGDGLVISLTPDVSHALESRGIPFKILSDFIDEKKIRENESAFLREQVQWVNRFDALIKRYVRFCGKHDIDFMRMSFHQLKYFIDTLVIQIRSLRDLLGNMTPPLHLIYVRRKPSHPLSIQGFSNEAYSALYPLFISSLCRENAQWSFQLEEMEGERSAGAQARGHSPERLKFFWDARLFIKGIWLWLKFAPGACAAPQIKQEKALNLFFAHYGNAHLDFPVRQLCRRGHRVFLFFQNTLLRLNRRGIAKIKSPGNDFYEILGEIEQDLKDFSENHLLRSPEGQELLGWLEKQCGFSVAEFILPAFQEFLVKAGGKTLALALHYKSVYLKNKIDFVVSHSKTDMTAKAAFIAAGLCGVGKVMIQHGCQLFDDEVWNLSDFDLTDVYFTSDSLSEDLFRKSLNAAGLQNTPNIYQSPHYLLRFRQKAAPKPAARVRKLLYLPTKLRVHAKRFNLSSYPATWYFEYQKRLLDYFGTHLAGYDITYKQAVVKRRYADEAIIAYLHRKKYKNIRIDSRKTFDIIAAADAILMDRPTTAFFEAVVSKKPLLALYPDFTSDLIDERTRALFGKSLQSFSGHEEALKKIRDFLSGNPREYVHDMGLEGADFSAVLERLKPEVHSLKSMRLFELYSNDTHPSISVDRRRGI